MTDQQRGRVTRFGGWIGMGILFVAFSAIFGPFLLRDPPLFGGYSRREWLSIGIGLLAWGLLFELLFGVSSVMNA